MMRFFLPAFLLLGCGPQPPIEVGLNWELNTEYSSVTQSFWLRASGEPIESVGPLETASSCLLAETSAGTYYSEETGTRTALSKVIGMTEMYHPLVPNSAEFSTSLASVIQHRERNAGYAYDSTVTYDPESVIGNIEVNSYRDFLCADENTPVEDCVAPETEASFHGVSADEYAVKFQLGQLWQDPESGSVEDVELLTRINPERGDIWSSVDGNTVFISAGTEPLALGGKTYNVSSVAMYEVGTLQDNGADAINQCINIGLSQDQTNDPEGANGSTTIAFLDSACVDKFTHAKSGQQWWYGSVLVKEISENQEINITKWGYEWYELDETGSTCSRVVSDSPDNVNAALFIEYDLTTETRTSSIGRWTTP